MTRSSERRRDSQPVYADGCYKDSNGCYKDSNGCYKDSNNSENLILSILHEARPFSLKVKYSVLSDHIL
jgi:hypothetical protein